MDVYIVDKQQKESRLNCLNPLRWAQVVRRDVGELLFRDRFVIGYQVVANLKVRYQQSFLGVIWSLLNPILMLGVLAVVFSQIMNRRTVDMTFYLFSGLVPWQFFNGLISTSGKTLVGKASILTKIRINKLVFPVANLIDGLITLMLTVVALLILLCLIFRMPLHPQLVLFPLAALVLVVFSLGLSLFLMVATIYFRDLEHMMSVVLRGWYFFTPILYPIDRITNPKILAALNLNPMTHILRLFQKCIYAGQWPTAMEWAIPSVIAVSMLVIGYITYKSREDDLIFRL